MIVEESFGVFKVGNVTLTSAPWETGGIRIVNRVSKNERKWERVSARQWLFVSRWCGISKEQREFYRIG